MTIGIDYRSLSKNTLLKIVIPVLTLIIVGIGSAALALRVETGSLSSSMTSHIIAQEKRFVESEQRILRVESQQAIIIGELEKLSRRQDDTLWYLATMARDHNTVKEIEARRNARR
jgi:hypothetical protein